MSLIVEPCSTEELCAAFGANETLLNKLRDELDDWLKLQPHLPQGASKKRLESFILGTKMSLEFAKQKLDMHYTIRGIIQEFFAERDPRAPNLTTLYDVIQFVCLPKLTPEKYTVFVVRALVDDPSRTDPWQIAKCMLMSCDIQMEECNSFGRVYIFDLTMMSLGHLKAVTPDFLRKFQTAIKAYPVRIKGFHFINAPPFVGHLVAMFKAILSPKLGSRIHIHPRDNSDSIYKFVPKAILPKDYGGDDLSMDELSGMWQEKLNEWRDWFVEQNKISVNEDLRAGVNINGDNLFGFAGSFRKLDID